MPFTITPEHEAIFSAVASSASNLIIEAVAGAGKTTTIIEALKCLPVRSPDSLLAPSVAFLTFSRVAAEALAARVPRHVQATTFNSLGHRALSAAFPDSRKRRDWLDSRKCAKILWEMGEGENPDFQNILRLVGLLKSVPPEKTPPILRAAQFTQQHGFVWEDDRGSQEMACSVLRKSNALVESSIDFNDQLYLPVLLDLEFSTQDFIFIDEAQDTNEIQLEILDRLSIITGGGEQYFKNETFFCFVGDPWQAIYGFRGAQTDSMSVIASRFSCKTLPLSVSYRCPRSIVLEAQKWMREMI